ncbi:MAG TPA: YciI family protein, partial [Longimicrobiales bacterium]|nr:YciI family protein [Longimicrobiales bacterium]
MRYLILIYDSEADAPETTDAEMQQWFEYTERLKSSGGYLGGEALMPTSTATTVRKNGSKVLTTDGPFAETKEQLGGYYLIDVASEAEALEWAARLPGAKRGSVEVRPLMPIP